MDRAVALPDRASYILKNARVPLGCLEAVNPDAFVACVDRLALVDIEVRNGTIANISPAEDDPTRPRRKSPPFWGPTTIDLHGKMILPTFADLHTHIDKGHTTERSRNPDGSLSGADRSTAADAQFWDADDVLRRMDFSVKCAYAHGTSAIRTHLINMTPKQTELTWPAFSKLRQKWQGRVDVQAVSLVVLSFFRDEEAARKLADTVAEHNGLLGAAVCCAERGGHLEDDWTTCENDRDELLDRIFLLAKERNLDLDFHTDENGNEVAKGLRYVAQKTIQHGYQGRVVCGHCCSLAYQRPDELEKTLALAAEAGITVVSLPLVNQWTQDRDHHGGRTPRWRGITLLHEAKAAGVPVAIASDNTRDQFYAYGDLDMLEVFNQGCRMAHLDRPYGDWVQCVTSTPANAMGLTQNGRLCPGGKADYIIFRARRYSELLSRPQMDRVVVRNGKALNVRPPDYSELDYVPEAIRTGDVPVFEVTKYSVKTRGRAGAEAVVTSVTRLGSPRMVESIAGLEGSQENNQNGAVNGRWSGHVGSGTRGGKRRQAAATGVFGGAEKVGFATMKNAGWLAVFAVLAAVFAVLFSTQIIVVVGIDHLLTKYAYFITSKNDTTETIQEQEGIRPLSGGAPSLDHYSDTTLGASPHHSPPKSSSAWHEDGNILNTGGVQYSDANSSMGNLSDYHQQGASPDENTGEPRKIVVLGVPWQTEDATLLSHFSKYGTVEEAQIMRERYTGKSRGFGFVTFSTTAEAQHAIAAEHVIDARRCEAKFALPEGKVGSARTTRIFIARIPSSVSDLQFRNYFEQFGAVQDAYMPKDASKQGHRGIGFVTYASSDSVEHVMSQSHVLNGNEVAIDRATPKERTQGATLPGRLSMSQPNLHMLSASGGGGGVGGGGGSAGGSAHGGGAFPAFTRGNVGGGLGGGIRGMGSGVFPPNSSSYYYGDPLGAGVAPHFSGGSGGGLGNRHMSHPILSTTSTSSQFGSPPYQARGSSSVTNLATSPPTSAGYGSNASLHAFAAQAALQQHLSSNSLSSLDGTGSSPTPHQQQQLINLINANVAAAGAAAAVASTTTTGAVQQRSENSNASTNSRFPPSGPSSSNDLQGISRNVGTFQSTAAGGGGTGTGTSTMANINSSGPPSSRAGPRIFVGKLNRETSDQDVKDYFSRFGYVLDVYLPRDKTNRREHRGFGFVTFETEASIQRVVSQVPHYIRGSVIAIDSAVPRQDEMMVLTIDNPVQAVQHHPSQQQHMQYHQQYYPLGPGPGTGPLQQQQYHPYGMGGGGIMHPGGGQQQQQQQQLYSAPMPVPPSASGLSQQTGDTNPANEALNAFESLSLGVDNAAAVGNGSSLSSL